MMLFRLEDKTPEEIPPSSNSARVSKDASVSFHPSAIPPEDKVPR